MIIGVLTLGVNYFGDYTANKIFNGVLTPIYLGDFSRTLNKN